MTFSVPLNILLSTVAPTKTSIIKTCLIKISVLIQSKEKLDWLFSAIDKKFGIIGSLVLSKYLNIDVTPNPFNDSTNTNVIVQSHKIMNEYISNINLNLKESGSSIIKNLKWVKFYSLLLIKKKM